MKLHILIFIIIYSLISFYNSVPTCGQDVRLNNPSFEDDPGDAVMPMGWYECSDYTTPDILPGYWGVYTDAHDGMTYVGLITRQDESAESIGQRLSKPLVKDACYNFQIDLAHSNTYAGYNAEATLEIWISEDKCESDQLIYQSDRISNKDWKTINIQFYAELSAQYIHFAVRHIDKARKAKGNVLMDNITPLKACNKA